MNYRKWKFQGTLKNNKRIKLQLKYLHKVGAGFVNCADMGWVGAVGIWWGWFIAARVTKFCIGIGAKSPAAAVIWSAGPLSPFNFYTFTNINTTTVMIGLDQKKRKTHTQKSIIYIIFVFVTYKLINYLNLIKTKTTSNIWHNYNNELVEGTHPVNRCEFM